VHPDVKRMLMQMRALTAASRTICYANAVALDISVRATDADTRALASARGEFLTLIAKAFSTDIGNEVTSLGVQVHGGMGFIEETGAAQHLRDARITTIYEGTTGIQANDLVGRKMGREEGRTALALIAEMEKLLPKLSASPDANLKAIGDALEAAIARLRETVRWVSKTFPANPAAVAA